MRAVRRAPRVGALLVLLVTGCATFGGRSGDDGSPPSSFVRSTSELRATRMVEVREGLTRAQAMRSVIEALEEHHIVEVTDPRAGFVMTAWQSSLTRAGVPDLRYRTRLTARFLGDDWRRLQLRGEANWARGDEWDIGYDVTELDNIVSELRTRLSSPRS